MLNREAVSIKIAKKALDILHELFADSIRGYTDTALALSEEENFLKITCGGVLKYLFPEEVNFIRREIEITYRHLINLTEKARRTFALAIVANFERLTKISYIYAGERIPGLAHSVFTGISKEITDFHQKIIKIGSRRQTFLSSVALLIELSNRTPGKCRILVEGSDAPIIRVWSKLADRNFGLAPSLLERISQISDLYSDLGQRLKTCSKDISNFLSEGNRKALSSIIDQLLSQSNKLADLGDCTKQLTQYVNKHLQALLELRQLAPKEIENYIEKVFVNRGFAEFEVYSTFIRLGIPAIPRLKVPYEDEKGQTRYEVDVLAAPGNELWIIEVKTGKSLEKEKLENLNKVKQILDADRVVLIVDELEEAKKVVDEAGYENFTCFSFSDLTGRCGFFQRYLRALSRKRQKHKDSITNKVVKHIADSCERM